MCSMIEAIEEAKAEAEDTKGAETQEDELAAEKYDEHMESLIQFPADGSNAEIIFFVLLFFRLLLVLCPLR